MSRVKLGLEGQKFNRWTVISFSHVFKNAAHWVCKCECGTIRTVGIHSVKSGSSKSCGCYTPEQLDTARQNATTHGYAGRKGRTAEYNIWVKLIGRCTQTNHKYWNDYGGRGILVCDRWRHSFPNFLADMGPMPSPKHSIDRYPNNDGNYEPNNCRWATDKEQARNKRSNLVWEFKGEKKCLSEWAEVLGIGWSTLRHRVVVKNWSIEKAFTTPVHSIRHYGRHPREARIEAVNKLILAVALRGRRYFENHETGEVAIIARRDKGTLWILNEHSGEWTYIGCHGGEWRGFHHGGTLRGFIQGLVVFIKTGKPFIHESYLCARHWAYPEVEMQEIIDEGYRLGIIKKELSVELGGKVSMNGLEDDPGDVP